MAERKEAQEVARGVPAEPSDEMLTAGVGELLGYAEDYEPPREAVRRIYAAMIAASQTSDKTERTSRQLRELAPPRGTCPR